jgi:hypothetical protein
MENLPSPNCAAAWPTLGCLLDFEPLMRFQLAAARISFAAFLVAAIIALAAVIGVRLGQFAYAQGFRLMIPAVAVGLIAFAAGAAWCISAFRRNESEGRRLGLCGFFGAILLLYPPLGTEARGLTAPPIHDAASDPHDAPHFVALAKLRKPGMNSLAFHPEQRIHFHGRDITVAVALNDYYDDVNHQHGFLLPKSKNPVATLFWRCFAAAKKLGWHIVDYSEKEGRIEATDTSFWFGLVSDIVIRVQPSGTIGARYDIRSESREGDIDYGANIDRLRRFVRTMHQ